MFWKYRTNNIEQKEIMENKVQVSRLKNRILVEIKNIDPLTSKEKLADDIYCELEFNSRDGVDAKLMKMTPWGT
jgi:hypothetical protein